MSRLLRVLIVEDSENDAALLLREIRRGQCDVVSERVETAAAMRAALAKQSWDIVISDYSMPHFSAPAALKVVQESGVDLPFIIVSGAIGEDSAVAAMKVGAHDYLMKGNLARLVPAIEREFREAEVRRERQRIEEENRVNLRRIRALHEINMAIASTLDLRAVLDILLEKIDLVLPYAAISVRLFNPKNGFLEPIACRNLDEEQWKLDQWRPGRGLANLVFETKAPLMIDNLQADRRVRDPDFFRKHGFVSYLGAPLIVKEEILGVLSFYTQEQHEFADEEVDFLSTLASQAAMAIHNAQLYAQIQHQAIELEKSNKGKNEFLNVVSHELRTPLNLISGYTEVVRGGMVGEINSEQETALGKVVSCTKDLMGTIGRILQATSIEAEAVKVDRKEIIVGHLLDDLKSIYDGSVGKEVNLQWAYSLDFLSMRTDSEKLKHILQNLIDNAIKFTERGQVTVSARQVLGAGSVEFRVKDSGVGIPKEMLPLVFEKFRQVDNSSTRAYGGVGLGLYIVKKFAEMLGGDVEVESELGKGTIFTVTLPTAAPVSRVEPYGMSLES